MKLWRIYTEDKPNLAEITSGYFDGFTLLKGQGYWEGVAERTAIIEVMQLEQNTTDLHAKVNALAVYIKLQNEQDSVLVTEQDVKVRLV